MEYGLVRHWAPHYGVGSFLPCTALVLSLSFSSGVFMRCWTWSRPRPHPWAFKELSLRVLNSRAPRLELWALNTKWAGTSDLGPHRVYFKIFYKKNSLLHVILIIRENQPQLNYISLKKIIKNMNLLLEWIDKYWFISTNLGASIIFLHSWLCVIIFSFVALCNNYNPKKKKFEKECYISNKLFLI